MGVIIGMDPHKSSATIEVVDGGGRALGKGRYGTDKVGYGQMLALTLLNFDRGFFAAVSAVTLQERS